MSDDECTGYTASWCRNCGTCSCPRRETGERDENSDACPLHGEHSRHAATLCAGGCGEVVVEDGDRCLSCECERLRADNARLDNVARGAITERDELRAAVRQDRVKMHHYRDSLSALLRVVKRERSAREVWLASLPGGSCGNPAPAALIDAEAATGEAIRALVEAPAGESGGERE